MSKKTGYTVESDFDDLHGDPAEAVDLEVDLSDSDNPIIQAFVKGKDDDDYQPPEGDDDEKKDKKGKKKDADDKFVDDDEDDDTLVELDDDDKEDDDDDDEDDLDDDNKEAEEGDDDDDDGDDDDKRSYSKRVQARIDRERDLRLADNADSNRRIAKLERENKLFKAQSVFKEDGAESDRKLRVLRKDKAEAIEEGDTEKQVDIDDKILDIKSDLKVKQFELKQLEDSIDDEKDAMGDTVTPAAGQKWLEKYPQFHTNSKFQKGVLLADKMVAAQGLDKNTDKYYREMEKILAVQYPSIVKLAKTSKKGGKRTTGKKRGAVGGTQKAGTRRVRRGVIRLTKNDQEQMEIFGMDPKNVTDVKAWADSKAGG